MFISATKCKCQKLTQMIFRMFLRLSCLVILCAPLLFSVTLHHFCQHNDLAHIEVLWHENILFSWIVSFHNRLLFSGRILEFFTPFRNKRRRFFTQPETGSAHDWRKHTRHFQLLYLIAERFVSIVKPFFIYQRWFLHTAHFVCICFLFQSTKKCYI